MSRDEVELQDLHGTDFKGKDVPSSTIIKREKTITLMGALSLVTGCIIGSGIFISVGPTLGVTSGSVGILMIVWCVGGLVSLLGGMCYVELGCLLPKSGGERTYIAEAFGSNFSVVFTYSYVFLVKTITLAALAITTGKYFVEMIIPNCYGTENPTKLVAYATIFIVLLINVLSNKVAANTQIFFTIAKMLALFLVIISGFVYMWMNKINVFQDAFKIEEFKPMALGVAFISVFWSFEGWNNLGSVVGDMKNPVRDLPIAVCLGVAIVIILYTSTIISYLAVLGYATLSRSETVAIQFASVMFKQGSFIIPVFICCSTFGACNGLLLSVTRVSLISGVEGEIPRVFSLVHRTKRTPIFSLVSMVLITCIFVPLDFELLVEYCAFITWFFYFLAMASLIYMKIRRKDLVSKFRVPIVLPIIIQLVAVFMVVMSFWRQPQGCSAMLLVILFIFAIHWLPDRFLKPKWAIRAHDAFSHYLQMLYNLEYADEYDVS